MALLIMLGTLQKLLIYALMATRRCNLTGPYNSIIIKHLGNY
jgi:hypothetical protein